MPIRKSRQEESIPMRVQKGALVPADGFAQMRLREKNFQYHEIVTVKIRRMREYWYHKWVHLFGQMLAENLEDFRGMKAHQVLKRLQAEAVIGCEPISMRTEDGELVVLNCPKSLAYDQMDQAEFEEVFQGFCQHVVARYWPGLDQDQIVAMMEVMEDQVA